MRPQKSVLPVVIALFTLVLASSLSAQTPAAQQPSALAHARVVSLTLIHGTVIARKPGSPAWARATLDMSLGEGMSIATARDSFAEVQFENGSTLRIGELSRVDFTQMALAPRGGRVSHFTLAFGLVTANVAPARHDEYLLRAAGAALAPQGKSEFRVDLAHSRLRVEVFRGHLDASDSTQSAKLTKNQVLSRADSVGSPFEVTAPIHPDQWDNWVRQRDQEITLAAYRGTESLANQLNDWSHVIPPAGLFVGATLDDGF